MVSHAESLTSQVIIRANRILILLSQGARQYSSCGLLGQSLSLGLHLNNEQNVYYYVSHFLIHLRKQDQPKSWFIFQTSSDILLYSPYQQLADTGLPVSTTTISSTDIPVTPTLSYPSPVTSTPTASLPTSSHLYSNFIPPISSHLYSNFILPCYCHLYSYFILPCYCHLYSYCIPTNAAVY